MMKLLLFRLHKEVYKVFSTIFNKILSVNSFYLKKEKFISQTTINQEDFQHLFRNEFLEKILEPNYWSDIYGISIMFRSMGLTFF